MLTIYEVIKKHTQEFKNPIKLSVGEKIICTEKSDPNGDWPNWIFCKTENNEGWVPDQIIEENGEVGIIIEDYCAIEFDLEIGEILFSEKILNGWIWGYKKDNPNVKTWAPLNHLAVKRR